MAAPLRKTICKQRSSLPRTGAGKCVPSLCDIMAMNAGEDAVPKQAEHQVQPKAAKIAGLELLSLSVEVSDSNDYCNE